MTASHLDPGEVDRFLRGELSGGDNRRLVRSLISAWRICRHPPSILPARADEDYSHAFEGLLPALRAKAEEVSRERRLLPGLMAQLRTRSVPELKDLLVGEGKLRRWLFCEQLIEELRRSLYIDPLGAKDMAELAVAIAMSLDPEAYGVSLIRDLQARAWAHAGDALRVLSDLRSAEEAFATAENLVLQGTGDALEEAQIHELEAALRRDQHRPAEAHRLLDEVIAVYRQYRDSHLVGRAFIQKGEVHGSCGELEPAIRWLRKGLDLIDPTRDRHLDLSVRQSLMLCLHESGRHREARFLLKASRPEFQQHGGELLNLRLGWLEGKIYGSLGFVDKAEECLAEARQGFIRLEIGFSAAAVSLDLAALYASQGRSAEIHRLSAEMLLIFQARDLHQEAVAALIAFQRAVAMEGVSSKLLADLRSYLERARKDPQLRFEPA